jgi:hypothetical protein
MAQAWHKRRELLALDGGPEAACWRASQYRADDPPYASWIAATIKAASNLKEMPSIPEDRPHPPVIVPTPNFTEMSFTAEDSAHPPAIEAAPNSTWERFRPFDSYQLRSKARDAEVGPHLMFLWLKRTLEDKPHLFHKTLKLFVDQYGLLGLFQENYVPHPVLPPSRMYIAPEAVIDKRGRLRRIDPSTQGRELVLKLKEDEKWFTATPDLKLHGVDPETLTKEVWESSVAAPSEVRLVPRVPEFRPWLEEESNGELAPWEAIKEQFGALLILDH